jgi:hypothetical protein
MIQNRAEAETHANAAFAGANDGFADMYAALMSTNAASGIVKGMCCL